jgi:aldehyde dehydrogenase family 7 protein A1
MSLLRRLSSHSPAFRYSPTRLLSTRASRVLSALDLPTASDGVIPGVFDGTWKGSGPIVETKCPATGEVIGRIRTVSPYSLYLASAI